MATRLKTVEFWFPHLTTAADNTDVNFAQITVYLPENTKVFKSVVLDVSYHDANTTLTGTNDRRQVSLRLGAAGYTAVDDTTVKTLSGENYCDEASGDFTSHFTTNWTGTSMTCDARFLYDMSTGSPTGARNLSARLTITYTYDDTSTTHIKTVRIPLNAPVGAVGTSKPAETAPIADLSTLLPENTVVIRQTCFVVQGNSNGASTDSTITFQVDTDTAFTSQSYEHGGNQSFWFRLSEVGSFTTNAAHSWYLWGSVAIWSHLQCWLVVTYEFNDGASSSAFNSVMLPVTFDGTMGNAAGDYNRIKTEFWIEEPTTITLQRTALYLDWEQQALVSGLNARIGTGSFVTYTETNASVMCGSNGLMIFDPGSGAIALARGRNTLQADIYNTDTLDFGFAVTGFWLVNYTSGKATGGVGGHNHTVVHNLKTWNSGGQNVARVTSSAFAFAIPETDYFVNNFGFYLRHNADAASGANGWDIGVERLTSGGEGGIKWDSACHEFMSVDSEFGVRHIFGSVNHIFLLFTGDITINDKLDIETARRWRMVTDELGMSHFDLFLTYHTISFAVAGDITNSAGGTVNIYLHRSDALTTKDSGQRLKSTSRSGNGAYSITWFDSVENVYIMAYEDSTHLGRSTYGVAV